MAGKYTNLRTQLTNLISKYEAIVISTLKMSSKFGFRFLGLVFVGAKLSWFFRYFIVQSVFVDSRLRALGFVKENCPQISFVGSKS